MKKVSSLPSGMELVSLAKSVFSKSLCFLGSSLFSLQSLVKLFFVIAAVLWGISGGLGQSLHCQGIQIFTALSIPSIRNVTYPLKPCRSRMYQTTNHFKKHLNHCPAEECLAFCAPLVKSEVMALLCIWRPCSVIFFEPSALFVFHC